MLARFFCRDLPADAWNLAEGVATATIVA